MANTWNFDFPVSQEVLQKSFDSLNESLDEMPKSIKNMIHDHMDSFVEIKIDTIKETIILPEVKIMMEYFNMLDKNDIKSKDFFEFMTQFKDEVKDKIASSSILDERFETSDGEEESLFNIIYLLFDLAILNMQNVILASWSEELMDIASLVLEENRMKNEEQYNDELKEKDEEES